MSSRFNQKMFGRILTKKSDDLRKAYYIPGVLDSVPHFRIFEGRVFVGTMTDIDFDPVIEYCSEFMLSTAYKENEELHLRTGRQRWKFHAKEKGVVL